MESAFSQLGQLAKDGVKIIQFNHSDKAKVKVCEDYRKALQQENAGEKINLISARRYLPMFLSIFPKS